MAKKAPAVWNRNKGVRRVAVRAIIDNPLNFRLHPPEQQAALAATVERIGWYGYPDVYETDDGRFVLVDGELRAHHLREKYGDDATIEVNLTSFSADEAALALASHDSISALAKISGEKLNALMSGLDFSEALAPLGDFLAGLADKAGIGPPVATTQDKIPARPKKPTTKPGDIWQMGNHRVLCGDCTNAEGIKRLMRGKLASVLFTSPPYAQQREYTEESKASGLSWDAMMRGMVEAAPVELSAQMLVNLGLVHDAGEWVPYWDEWIAWMRQAGWRRFGWYVWDQGVGLPGDWNGRFAPSHEFIFHFNRIATRPAKSIGKKTMNIKARSQGKSTMRGKDGVCKEFTSPEASAQPNKIPDSVVRINRIAGGHGIDHPAVFPVELPAFVLRSWPGLVYDPFMGSGTTLIAAEQLKRIAYGTELSPAYCDVIVSRWEKLTGKKAKLERGSNVAPRKSPSRKRKEG